MKKRIFGLAFGLAIFTGSFLSNAQSNQLQQVNLLSQGDCAAIFCLEYNKETCQTICWKGGSACCTK